MIRFFYQRRKTIALFFIGIHVLQVLTVQRSFALTSGPTQPEVQGFQPAGSSEMVDLFTGDFAYNIPLFELPGPNGGYPFNLSYQSGVSMDTEASWVGLGFSLQPGSINRQMRGLPDEFKGDVVRTKMAIAPSVTVGLGAGVGVEFFGRGLALSSGFSVYMNNYRGMGYSIDNSLGFGRAVGSGMNAGIGLSTSLDSKEGVNISPSLSLSGKLGEAGLGTSYNSKDGLGSITLSYEAPKTLTANYRKRISETEKKFLGSTSAQLNASASLSLAHTAYTPQVSMPMRNTNLSLTFKIGAGWWGVHPNAYGKGFYNEQRLENNNKYKSTKAYGYLNYEGTPGEADMMDFNREKDGMVMKESPNLGMPSLTYDIYSVVGQGISAMYRPMRNDIGIVRDQTVESVSNSVAAGVDVGIPAHVGANLNVNHSKSVSGGWTDANSNVTSLAGFMGRNLNEVYEPSYFKAHGEMSYEDVARLREIGDEDAVRLRLAGDDISPYVDGILEKNNGVAQVIPAKNTLNRDRKPRNQTIHPITNEQLVGASGESINTFKIQYLDSAGELRNFKRSSLPPHHTAGFTALTTEGLRYTYGIPAYNLKQEEVTFSALPDSPNETRVRVGTGNAQGDPTYQYDGTDKFLKRVNMPQYAHAYLLTSIVGPDYIDVLGDGVTEDDLGYWVKFTYQKTTDDFRWRDPYSKAHLQQGWKTDPRDDRGSFTYGQKELWYLAKAETKSHIATFTLSSRDDGKGVKNRLQDSDSDRGRTVYKLSEIKLFTRPAAAMTPLIPIKVIKFDYDYTLCSGVFNNSVGGGKLTLKQVWFEYGGSQRGRLNPYKFTYGYSPGYDQYANDRWGTYKPYPLSDPLQNVDGPYSIQDPTRKSDIDKYASAWSLTQISLPSGGKIVIDYESDDYAYVQHKPAMQMMELVDPGSNPVTDKFALSDDNLKVRFKLEQPLAGTLTAAEQRMEIMKYFDPTDTQIYFKIKVNLRSSAENFYEYVSGYVDYARKNDWGLEKDSNGKFAYGYFYVNSENNRNPFSLRAWQHIRTNQPDLANSGKTLKQTDNANDRINQIKSLGSVITQIRAMFEGFYGFCSDKQWGRDVMCGKSWVRLYSPDKIKFGGGLRVRQITMDDNWSGDEEGRYGQVYEYSIQEDGRSISSGVATYEPIIGGEENALHYAKKYTQAVPLRSDNNLYFEYPINESYYPSPQVGYRKVTITSLAAAALAGKDVKNINLSDGRPLFPRGNGIGYGTTGATVHEFFTAKDFPVITDETDKKNKPYKLSFSIPFLGSVSVSKLTTSQGYSIVTNDMHGKVSKVSNYRQDKEGRIEAEPISWVKYNYGTRGRTYQGRQVQELRNTFTDNGDGTISLLPLGAAVPSTAVTLGQEHEFFMDLRQFEDNAWGGGAYYNVDLIYILFGAIPIPTSWPDVSKSTTQLRTAVTNKIIFKSGILESTEAYDGSSRVITRNLKWDKLTGAIVLKQMNNNFDASVYSYSIPAYKQYQGMGAAYQNIGLTFAISELAALANTTNEYSFATTMDSKKLFPGDEILLYPDNSLSTPITRVIYMGNEEEGILRLYSPGILTEVEYKAMIVRSGYRNQLSVMAGTINGLQDPSKPGVAKNYSKTMQVPVSNN